MIAVSKFFQIAATLRAAGLPLASIYVREDRVYGQYTRPLTRAEADRARAILSDDFPQDRLEPLDKADLPGERMMRCIMELLIEDKEEALMELKELRSREQPAEK